MKRSILLKVFLALLLVFPFNLFNTGGNYQAEALTSDGSMTVTEALASYEINKENTDTVEGYIVGHATGSNTANFNAPFSNDFNFLIADSPTEHDKTRLIDVQIPSGDRNQFGLQSNPSIVGKEVKITGSFQDYNSFPGLKLVTEISFVDDSDNPPPQDPTSTDPLAGAGKKVLFDNTHGETSGAADWVINGGFSDFADALKADGFTVDQLDRSIPYDFGTEAITLDKLSQYDVFILGEANVPFKASEQQAMLDYVKNGGSIFFIADHYNSDRNLNRWDSGEVYNGYRRGAWGSPTKGMGTEEANSAAMKDVTSSDWLKNNFGVRFRTNAIGDITNGETVVSPSDSFGITQGVTTVEMHAGSTLSIINPDIAKGLIYLPENPSKWSSAVDEGVYNGGGIDEGAFAAISKVGKGKAAFIGDSSPAEDSTPKYLREDNGGKKTGFDGFSKEGQDKTYFVNTVEWLANQEDYTSFEGKIPLSQPTPLRDDENDPSLSTEPEHEPWTTPPSGYKWYDSSTFKPGSFGSEKEASTPTIPELTTIAKARQADEMSNVTVEGVITTKPGIWGSKGFYLQDQTGGVYVYQGTDNYHVGQKVRLTAQKSTYNGEIELSNIIQSADEGDGTVPSPSVVTTIDSSNQGQLVTLQKATVKNISKTDSYGTFEFDAVIGDTATRVRVDSRGGMTYDDFIATYKEGSVLNITGLASIFKNTYQIKPRSAEDLIDAESSPVNVQLLGINDLHGKIDQHYSLDLNRDGSNDGIYGGMEYLASYIKEREKAIPNSLLVGVGDIIGGSPPLSALFQDEPTVDIMNAMGMDVSTIGNHEFDEGTTELLRMVNGGDYPKDNENRSYEGMNYPELAANVVYKDSGQPILPPYAIKTVGGEQIGFIGVTTKSTPDMVMPGGIQDIKFTDPVEAINQSVSELHKKGVHAIVVLAHSPATQGSDGSISGEAADLAKSVDDDVDVIFAAHNHAVDNGTVDNKLIVQASEYGKAFSDVDLTIDPVTDDIVKKSADIIFVDDSKDEPDPKVKSILDKYETQVAPKLNEVEGEASIPMEGGYATKGEKGDNALGNLVADSMKSAMNSDFALMNGGGIRDNLDKGNITWNDLFNILPFGNTLVKMDITGKDLQDILNAQLNTYYGPDFSVAGFKYTWDTNAGRTVDIYLPDGSKISNDKTYTLTVNNFMATATGAKYKAIGDAGKNLVQGPVDVDALVDFVKSFDKPLAYTSEGRISEVYVPRDPDPNTKVLSISDAKAQADNIKVTVEGVVTSTPGEFGNNKSFYLQDGTGAINVYQSLDPGLKIGDKVKITATKFTYNDETELKYMTASQVVDHVNLSPKVISNLSDDCLYQFVSLQNVKISKISVPDRYGNFAFDVVNGDQTTTVSIDGRTGIRYEEWTKNFHQGDYVTVSGIASGDRLKPRLMDDIIPAIQNNVLNVDVTEQTGDSASITLDADLITYAIKKKTIIKINKGDIIFKLPSSDLKTDQSLTIKISNRTDVTDSAVIGQVYNFTVTQGDQEVSKFKTPVEITYIVDASKIEKPDNISIYSYKDTNGKWKKVKGDYQNGKISTELSKTMTTAVREVHSKEVHSKKDHKK
ncbi:5'-nucleotidase C-terminal domain-containing protein [Terrilactibacillus laevilacticus]|uniref:5'-nucleotidase C-terminal domain-containing protein n=1 Tax=Terrilactibacillus laevilacticus TaxID=1380157 RepID=UPI00114720AD|nr:5'-nucleotidase C-terminal domain-containing protein [Terrilactibacillus laevilacticus]